MYEHNQPSQCVKLDRRLVAALVARAALDRAAHVRVAAGRALVALAQKQEELRLLPLALPTQAVKDMSL